MPPVQLNRPSVVVWLVILSAALAWEVRGLVWRGQGDTLSELTWSVLLRWPGALVCALVGWFFLWHMPWGRGRHLGWPDLLAVACGVGVWLIARNNNP